LAAVSSPDLAPLLDVLRAAERLKHTTRNAYTADGAVETVAAHTWRVAFMALLVAPHFPEVEVGRLVQICLVHDLGEAISGDVPAPEQERRRALDPTHDKAAEERADLLTLLAPLAPADRDRLLALWDEYEANATPEARLAKALDKLETILQHVQGANPPGFDYRYNLEYGRRYTTGHPLLEALRAELDLATEARAQAADRAVP
jgi:putative hydrolase of HD superfamily